jgi:hypothetical protein
MTITKLSRLSATHALHVSSFGACILFYLLFVGDGIPAVAMADSAGRSIQAVSLGVVCDGHTDNAAAYAHLLAAEVGPSTIVFPGNGQTCVSSKPLRLKSNTVLTSSPATAVLAPTLDDRSNPLVLRISNASHVTISGITIDGGWPKTQSTSAAVTIYKSSYVLFKNITIRHTNGIGINFSTGISYSGVSDSNFVDVGGYAPQTPGVQHRQAVAFSSGADNNNNFVTYSHFDGSGLDEISATQQVDFVVGHNILSHTSGGACIYGAGDKTIEVLDNKCSGASGNGIDLYRDGSVVVRDNVADLNGASGISVADVDNEVTITGNKTRNNNRKRKASAGILVGTDSAAHCPHVVTIKDNVSQNDDSTRSQSYGLKLVNLPNSLPILGNNSNRFSGNSTEDVARVSESRSD